MNKRISIIIVFLVCVIQIYAQEKPVSLIGFNPSITAEPFYEKGEFDINIFPLVYLMSISTRNDIRFTTLLNYGIRNETNAITHIGFETAIPFYLVKKDCISKKSKGLFIAPVLSLSRNILEEHNNIGLWLEPGYLFEFSDSFAIQVGTTYFNHDNYSDDWKGHFGVKVILGWWM